jgi:Family of unknown function (DUF5946)
MADLRESGCPGCGERLPESHGATHPYVGASSACWTRFAHVNATLPPATPLRRLVTDAYMVQHPGVPERRAIQSVGVHLVALCLVLDHGLPPEKLSSALQRIVARPPAWRWLDPPVPNGSSTITEVGRAAETGDTRVAVEAYVRGVWQAWAAHHDTVAGWVDGLTL